ncbi:DUF7837 family putative zinc-binding protein [Halobellus sp. GM3]|uniref:DUF7837 family putative zinc-binding protein n=1 Tax=Halobellus sp. GM3 TaxID=3458410 RepID=UPI00403DAACA
MNSDTGALGVCPDCGNSISHTWRIIDYQDENGNSRCFAECPDCEKVVKPK